MRHVRTWKMDGYKVQLFDTGREDDRGRPDQAYKIWHDGAVVLEGDNYCPSPMIRPGSNRAIADVLVFLSQTDTEWHDKLEHTPEQRSWVRAHADEMSVLACILEEDKA